MSFLIRLVSRLTKLAILSLSSQIYPGTIEEKRTTVPFIYNLKGEGLDEGLNIDVVDFPGVDDRDESVSDLTPLLLHLVQIIIFVVNVR